MQRCCIWGLPQSLHERLVAQRSRQAGQHCQMLVAGIGWRQKEDHQVHRQSVDRSKFDRPGKPHEQREESRQHIQPCMWQGKPLPQSGRSKILARLQRIQYRALVER